MPEITSPILVYSIHYVCNPDLRSSTQSSTGTQSINNSKMPCNKCRRNNDDHVKTTNNIRLVNSLLEATTPLEESREKTEGLALRKFYYMKKEGVFYKALLHRNINNDVFMNTSLLTFLYVVKHHRIRDC